MMMEKMISFCIAYFCLCRALTRYLQYEILGLLFHSVTCEAQSVSTYCTFSLLLLLDAIFMEFDTVLQGFIDQKPMSRYS